MRLPKFLERRSRATAPADPVDLTSEAFFQNPYPIYEALRSSGGAHRTTTGALILVRHEDIKNALTHPDLGNAPSRFSALGRRFRDSRVAASVAAHIPPFQDKPEHVITRRALSRAFARRFSEFEPELVDIANEVVSTAPRSGDLFSSISSPFSVAVMQRFIGLHAMDHMAIKRASAAFFHLFAPLNDASVLSDVNGALGEYREAVLPLVRARRDAPASDLISYLVEFKDGDSGLDNLQIADLTLLILADGIENIEASVATAMVLTAQGAGEAIHGGAAAAAIEEVLRLETPGQIIPRVARIDTEVAGVSCKADMPVLFALGSANRDERVFPSPDLFDATRGHDDVLTFGRGKHSCIGAPLARAMLIALTTALVRAGAQVSPSSELTYAHRFGHRWPNAVKFQIR